VERRERNMSNLAKTKELKSLLASESMQNQFAASLPKHLTPERFGRVAMTAITRTPKLVDCSRESFMQCLLDLSAMGLEPDNQRAYLIPYGNVCTLIVSYKGLVELMRRAGDVASIHADIVCENDEFIHNMGAIEKHTFDLRKPRGEMFAAYCQVTFKDGAKQAAIMSKEEIDAIKKRSKSGNNGPWVSDYNEMAKKTVVRRVSKMITLSPEIMEAVERSDRHEFGEMRNVTKAPVVRVQPIDPFAKLESAQEIENESNEEGGAE
jgi:recombination protein RecT